MPQLFVAVIVVVVVFAIVMDDMDPMDIMDADHGFRGLPPPATLRRSVGAEEQL